jgi:uncharacterized surface protein with fasciclin (FAS1) repeats
MRRDPQLVVGTVRSFRPAAAVALVSILLLAGCSSARSFDGASPVAAADEVESGESTIVPLSTEPTAPPSLPTLHDLLAQDRFVALAVALERSGLDSVLDGLEEFVLFAPTDAAFASSGADIGIEYPTLMNDQRLLEAILRYHVVAGPSTNQSWRTMNGASLAVEGDEDAVARVDGVEVLDRIPVPNGTVFVIRHLLLPGSNHAPPAGSCDTGTDVQTRPCA